MWRYQLMRVRGSSMSPTFRDGDVVLVDRHAFYHCPPRPGDIVAARPPDLQGKAIVKRITAVSTAGVTLIGDNPDDSLDSRRLGPILFDRIVGRVCRRLWPPRAS